MLSFIFCAYKAQFNSRTKGPWEEILKNKVDILKEVLGVPSACRQESDLGKELMYIVVVNFLGQEQICTAQYSSWKFRQNSGSQKVTRFPEMKIS